MSDAGARARFHPLRIREVRRETQDAVSIAFDVPEHLRDLFRYAPGQFLTLRATLGGAEVRRSYSLCSGLDDAEWRIAVKHVPDGAFSHHANATLRPGDTVEVMPPDGRFGVPAAPTEARVYVGIAAGSGITPIMAILRTVLSREPRSRFVLLYGSRTTPEIIFRGALEDLKDKYLDRLSVFHVLSREAQDLPVLAGRLDPEKLRVLLPGVVDPARVDHFFICGPAGMAEALPGALRELGVAPERIHVERFVPAGGAAPPPRPAPGRANAPAFAMASIIHDGKTSSVPMADGEAVLDAGLRAGLNLPWSCRGGMCSTCRARLREGSVTMTQNYALEPWETEAGYILTCQSHPTTRHVTVDYDQV